MPRYFFDIHDSVASIDDVGSDLPDLTAVRAEAMSVLPEIAASEIPVGDDRRHFTVLVRDEGGAPVYSATLTYTGIWLAKPH